MKILNKLTYDYLKLNKKKCIATLVSIILITVLLFSVGIFVSTIRKTALDAVIAEDGTKHVLFSEQDYSNYSILNSDENIKSIEITCLIDIINDELSIESIDDSLWDGISISKGRIPNNTNEIVISSAYASTYNLDVSSFVGEKEVVGIYNDSTLKNDLYTAFTKEVDYNNRTVNFYVTYKNIFNIYDKIYNTADNLRLNYSIVMGHKSYAYTWVNSSYLALLGQFANNNIKLGVYALIFFAAYEKCRRNHRSKRRQCDSARRGRTASASRAFASRRSPRASRGRARSFGFRFGGRRRRFVGLLSLLDGRF